MKSALRGSRSVYVYGDPKSYHAQQQRTIPRLMYTYSCPRARTKATRTVHQLVRLRLHACMPGGERDEDGRGCSCINIKLRVQCNVVRKVF